MEEIYYCETKIDNCVCGRKGSAEAMCAVHLPGRLDQVACVRCAKTARQFGFQTENLAVVLDRQARAAEVARRDEAGRVEYWKGVLAEGSNPNRQAPARVRRDEKRQQRDERAVGYEQRRNGAAKGFANVG